MTIVMGNAASAWFTALTFELDECDDCNCNAQS
jgi:hypothetical protein